MGWLKYMLTAGLLVGTVHTAIAGVVVGARGWCTTAQGKKPRFR